MKEFVEKLIERLEEEKAVHTKFYRLSEYKEFPEIKTRYELSMHNLNKAIRIVKQLAEEYMTCYKSCAECEAYDKEKHHCPKFCYIIEETVKEIEENHNGWIPCSERLPKEEEVDVIISTKAVGVTLGLYTKRYGYGMQEGFITNHGFVNMKNVEAWQPLPEAYKPEERKKIPTDHYEERFNRVV